MPILNGFIRVTDSSTSTVAVNANKQKRISFGSTELSVEGAETAALLHGRGTATTPVSIGTTANKNFMGYWLRGNATTGDTRGLYLRLYLGAAGSGEALRVMTTADASGVAAGGTVNAIHATFDVATGGTLSGTGNAIRATLQIAAAVTAGGLQSCLHLDSNFGASAVRGDDASYIHTDNAGSDPTTNGVPLLFNMLNPDTSTFFTAAGTGANSCALAGGGIAAKAIKCSVGGTAYWLPLFSSNS